MTKIEQINIMNISTLVFKFSAAVNVASPGTSNMVLREKKIKDPSKIRINIPNPAFLAHNRLDKDNS
jgi:hypothetical protein